MGSVRMVASLSYACAIGGHWLRFMHVAGHSQHLWLYTPSARTFRSSRIHQLCPFCHLAQPLDVQIESAPPSNRAFQCMAEEDKDESRSLHCSGIDLHSWPLR